MYNIVRYVKDLFTKSKNNESEYNPNYILCHIIYDKNTKIASLHIDYDNTLHYVQNKTFPLSLEDTEHVIKDSDNLANFLYSLCNVKEFLPTLIMDNLANHRNDSDAHSLFIGSTIRYLDQVILQKRNQKRCYFSWSYTR